MMLVAPYYSQQAHLSTRVSPPATNYADERQHIAAMASSDRVSITPELLSGVDMFRSLGTLVLGGEEQIREWENQGLTITYETYEKAFEVLNQSFREHMNNRNSSGVAFNRHQIVMSSQAVPEWFAQEQLNEIAALGNEHVRESFSAGEFYYVNVDAGVHRDAINVYREIGG